jgi:hypothetical protein
VYYLNYVFCSVSVKASEQYRSISLSLSLSLSHARTHTEGVCVNAAVLVGDYLLTFRGSLLPPFSWCLQAKIPPEVECGKLSETFLAVY